MKATGDPPIQLRFKDQTKKYETLRESLRERLKLKLKSKQKKKEPARVPRPHESETYVASDLK